MNNHDPLKCGKGHVYKNDSNVTAGSIFVLFLNSSGEQ